MKNNYFKISNYKLSFLVGVVLVMSFFSCKLTKPREGVMVKIKQPVSNGSIVVSFFNANTDALLSSAKVSVKLIGVDAPKIANPGGAGTEIISKSGFVILELNEGVVPSETSPIKFFINCSASGFVTTTIPVAISEPGSLQIKVKMSENANLPDGTSRIAATLDVPSNGITAKETVIKLPVAKGNDKSTGNIVFPQGQKYYTSTGETVTEKLNITVTKHSAVEQESLESFPNTLEANFDDGSGNYFKTAGLFAIEMTTNTGKKVKTFEKPNIITTGIPSTLTDDNDKVLAVGDKVPVWSHSEETGLWKREGDATIEAGKGENAGQLQTSFPVQHLSFWKLGWRQFPTSCLILLDFESNFENNKFVDYRLLNGTNYLNRKFINIKSGNIFRILNAPASNKVKIVSINPSFTQSFDLKCGMNSIKITNLNPNPAPITLDLTVVCTNNQNSWEKLDLQVLYRRAGTGNYQFLGSMKAGILQTSELVPGNYDFQASYTTNEGGTRTYNVLNKQIVNGINKHEFPTQCFN